jgi:hypothetical protein
VCVCVRVCVCVCVCVCIARGNLLQATSNDKERMCSLS